jgi:heme/copper-type cytochrome/quinol oxidase subunit 3
MTGAPAASPGRRQVPARRVVVLAVLLEAAAVAAYAVFLVVETVRGPVTEPVAAVFLALLTLALAAALVLAARAVAAGRRAARAPVLVWQILQLAIGVPALTTRWYVGVPLVLLAVVAGLGVLRSDVLPDES